ncbi:MAG: ABC transporter permease [Salinivirgaceae bacterium]|nr:ABC transporter permease [Salinivirgaceae bacterium]
MSKIAIIISREYVTRVRKKSFLIMSIVGPILFAGLMIGPAWLGQMEDTEEKIIAVADSTHLFIGEFPETEYIKFDYLPTADIQKTKDQFYNSPYYAILYINKTVINQNIGDDNTSYVQLFSDKSPSLGVQMHISNAIEKRLERDKLKTFGIEERVLKSIKSNVKVKSVKLSKTGEEKENNFTLAMIIGYIVGFMIYFTIFFSGSQVMRGVIEEKTNRIIEVIISSVKPFQLMMGKIIGVGLVALTQFALWGLLTVALYAVTVPILMPDVVKMQQSVQVENFGESGSELNAQAPVNDEMTSEIKEMLGALSAINFGIVIGSFIFFFLGGYFLYAAMFAAIGSAVDSETDTQQFMLPVTLPMIFAIIVMVNIVQNPESPLAFWFSIIPFTSPIVMMARIPFGVPYSQIILSAVILVITFITFTWLAAKVYRTGVLMYGKKTSWKEMWKWLRYSN